MAGVLVIVLSVLAHVNIMLGFEVSLKICLLGSSVFLEHIGGKMEATPVASLSVSVCVSVHVADGAITRVNLIEMFVQR